MINYVNYCLVHNSIKSNTMTTIFQNDFRSRSGIINFPTTTETMIKSLAKSVSSLKEMNYSIKVVPVSITYDRILDTTLLSEEAIFGQSRTYDSLNVA